MSHQKDVLRVPAKTLGIFVHPSNRHRPVFDEGWELHFRIESIVRNDRDESLRRQRFGDESIIRLLPALPRAAIKEYDNWRVRLRAARLIHVKFLTRKRSVRLIDCTLI